MIISIFQDLLLPNKVDKFPLGSYGKLYFWEIFTSLP